MRNILVAAILLYSTPVYSESVCRNYDYQEIKEMTDDELRLEIKEIDKRILSNLESLDKAGSGGYDKIWNAYEACNDQKKRLFLILKKRPGYIPPEK